MELQALSVVYKSDTNFSQADMDDTASLKDAVAGSYAVFAVTNCECFFKYHNIAAIQVRSALNI